MRLFVFVAAALICIAPMGASPATEDAPPTEKEFEASKRNLKHILLAHLNASEAFENEFQYDIKSKDGKPLLSWRVALLPYLEEEKLWLQFKLDEPWDGPNNKKLIEKMPKVYTPVRGAAKKGETFYQVFAGPKAVFGSKVQPDLDKAFPDGLSKTGLVYEAGEPIIWTKPQDLPFDESKPLPKLGGMFDGEFHVGLADGRSVIRCWKQLDEKELKLLIMPADGIAPPNFQKLRVPDI